MVAVKSDVLRCIDFTNNTRIKYNTTHGIHVYRLHKQHPGGKWNDLSLQMFQLLISHFKLFFLSIWLVVNCHIFYIFTKCIFMSVFLQNAGLFGQRRKIPQFCCKPFSCALNEIVLNILKPHF